MAIDLGSAYISILPSTSKIAPAIKRDLGAAEKDAKASGKKIGSHLHSGISSGMKLAVGAGAGLLAAAGVGSFLKGSIDAARESNRVGKQTQAVLKSTQGASGMTAKSIGDLATKISMKTGVDDEAIQSGENLLLTFTNVRDEAGKGNKIFSRATGVITDMSAALGQDTKSSSIQLGKALNDPIKGITALSRVGVSFTEQQKKQVKAMVASGNTLGAQKLILHEVGKEFGGSAAAMATPADRLKVIMGNLQEDIGNKLVPILDKIGGYLVKKLPGWIDSAESAFHKMVPTIKNVGDKLKSIADFAVRNKKTLLALTGVVVAGYAAFKIYSATVKVVTAVTKGWNIVQKLLNGTMKLNPIGLVITALTLLAAGLIIAYKKSDTFRKIVDTAWATIKKAIHTAWTNTIKPALTAFWHFIKDTLVPIIKNLWNKVIKPVFRGIGATIKWAWNNLIKPYFRALWWYISKVLVPVIKFLWNKVVKPVFRGIGATVKWAWKNVIKPNLIAWKTFFNKVLFPVLRFLWNKVVKPVFHGIGAAIKWTWTHVIRPAFNGIKDGIGALKTGFRKGVDGIKKIWDGLKKATKAPVRFIINTVLNNGLFKAIGKIPGLKAPHIDLPKGFSDGGNTGPGPKNKPAGIVHADEHVWTKEEVRRAGGHGVMEAMRGAVMRGYKKGGAVWPTTGHRTSSYAGHDGVDINGPGQDAGNPIFAWRDGTITYAGWNRGYGHGIFEKAPGWPEVVYGHSSKVFVHTGQHVQAGQRIGLVGSTGNSSGPHLHFGHPGGTYGQAMALLAGAGAAPDGIGGGSYGGYGGPSVKEVMRGVKKGSWLNQLKHMGGFGKLIGPMVGGLAGRVKDFAKEKIGALIKKAGSFLQGAGNYDGPIKSAAMKALRDSGRGNQWNSLNKLVSHESGWNPHAQNPHSTAYGLFQFLNSTWRGVGARKSSDPAVQLGAGMRYIGSRYHDPNGAWNFWSKHHWYDNGGIANGVGFMAKNTLEPERVLTPHQTKSFDALVGHIGKARIAATPAASRSDKTRVTLHVGGKQFDAYMTEVAEDAISGNTAFAGMTGRMRR